MVNFITKERKVDNICKFINSNFPVIMKQRKLLYNNTNDKRASSTYLSLNSTKINQIRKKTIFPNSVIFTFVNKGPNDDPMKT